MRSEMKADESEWNTILPRSASSTDNSNGGASDTNKGGNILDDDAQKAKQLGDRGVGGLPGAIAALECASVA